MMATGGGGIEINTLTIGTERCDQLVVHDLHDHLAGRDRLHHLDADRLLLHAVAEGTRHVERDVGFKQCAADFAQCAVDLDFAQCAAAGKAVENAARVFPTDCRTSLLTVRTVHLAIDL